MPRGIELRIQFGISRPGEMPTTTLLPEHAEPTVVTPLQLLTVTICSCDQHVALPAQAPFPGPRIDWLLP